MRRTSSECYTVLDWRCSRPCLSARHTMRALRAVLSIALLQLVLSSQADAMNTVHPMYAAIRGHVLLNGVVSTSGHSSP